MFVAYREGCMYEKRIYKYHTVYGRAIYNIVKAEAGMGVCCLAPSQLSVSRMLDECGVWPSSPEVDVRVSRLMDPLKSWRPRLPKILLRPRLP
jgi:hypothetical protein